MYIFKFGGASVKNAEGIKNVISVLKQVGYNNTLIVVSAIGKTTNALEEVIRCYFDAKKELPKAITTVKTLHFSILHNLFEATHPVIANIEALFFDLELFLQKNTSTNYNFVYDQVVSYGELMSSTILTHYLNEEGIAANFLDSRTVIKTNDNYRNAKVNWESTQTNVEQLVSKTVLNVTQGFLGSNANNFTTTLGREGSDYTAAIFAYCLNAKSVTIWKDVPGVLNADPRYFKDTVLLQNISYQEAIELAFYGASVIHPKTIQPLQRKSISLHVKSFVNPKASGTVVNNLKGITPKVPCFILKEKQTLLALSTLDFSFLVEENISELFNLLATYKMKVYVIQNSAISFSVCFQDDYNNLEALLKVLHQKFKVSCYNNVSIYTVRHYTNAAIKQIEQNKSILLKQINNVTVQVVTK